MEKVTSPYYSIDKPLLAQFAKVGSQLNASDPIALTKFTSLGTSWYILSYDPETKNCYTYYSWNDNQWYMTLNLQDIIMANGVRDLSFIPCRVSDIKAGREM